MLSGKSDHYPLTKEESLTFLTKTLKITKEEINREANGVGLLNKIIQQMKHTVPFTNISMATLEKNDGVYSQLTLTKCKEDILSCRGGQCYWINSFLKSLLSLIGYKADFIGAGNRAMSLIDDFHQAIIVRDASYPGSIHLFDAGNAHPMFEAISLNFKETSPIYQYGKKTRRLFNCGRGLFKYCHLLAKDRNILNPCEDIISDGENRWRLDLEYRTKEVKSLPYFTNIAELLISNPAHFPPVHQGLRILGYPKGLLVSIENDKLTRMAENGDYIVTEIENNQKFVETVMKYFPQFSNDILEKAIKNTFWTKN